MAGAVLSSAKRSARALCAAIAAVLALGAGAAAQEAPIDRTPVPELEGRYQGIGSAAGMTVEISDADETPEGVFRDSNGVEARIGGGWREGALEALLNFPGRPVFARLAPAGPGMQMTVLPLDADGNPLRRQARSLAFLREGVEPPERPDLYQTAPERAGRETDPDVFLASYQYWTPEGVAKGFDNIGARYRTLIRLFPQLNADVLWKLCEAESQRGLLAEALRGQGADCAGIAQTVRRLQDVGRFADWKRAVDAAIDRLLPAVQCARGYIVKESVCAPASERIARAAASMETVGSALARWR